MEDRVTEPQDNIVQGEAVRSPLTLITKQLLSSGSTGVAPASCPAPRRPSVRARDHCSKNKVSTKYFKDATQAANERYGTEVLRTLTRTRERYEQYRICTLTDANPNLRLHWQRHELWLKLSLICPTVSMRLLLLGAFSNSIHRKRSPQ